MRTALAFVVLSFSLAALAADNPRIYIQQSDSWEVKSGGGGVDDAFGVSGSGGARPQTAEIIKTFNDRCPNVTINNRRDKADYVVLLQHEGGKSLVLRDNKVVVFNRDGDAILTHSTRILGNAVTDACTVIMKDWTDHPQVNAAVSQTATADADAKLEITSSPVGGDIEIDGKFVGNTPSSVELAPGEHNVAVKKTGFATWQRTVKITGGSINLVAELSNAQTEKPGQ